MSFIPGTPLTSAGLLEVAGTGAFNLLQGQLTCNLADVTAEHSTPGAHCNPKGRIISLFRLFVFADAWYLLMPRVSITHALSALKKYAIFFKASLTDVSDHYQINYTFKKMAADWPDTPDGQLTGTETVIIREKGNSPRYLLIGRNKQNLPCERISAANENDWKHENLIHLYPAIYPETTEKFFAHELNLMALGAISLEKGCYTGQEIIARMHYRGKAKTGLQYFSAHRESPPEYGAEFVSAEGKTSILVDYCMNNIGVCEMLIVAPLA
jgi:tRNA-modifying protein YgfZ